MATVKPSVLITLTCDHQRLIKINAQFSTIQCFKCGTMQKLKEVNIQEWRVKCGSCQYARWCGYSSVTANQIANAHQRSTEHRDITVKMATNDNAVNLRQRLIKMGILVPI